MTAESPTVTPTLAEAAPAESTVGTSTSIKAVLVVLFTRDLLLRFDVDNNLLSPPPPIGHIVNIRFSHLQQENAAEMEPDDDEMEMGRPPSLFCNIRYILSQTPPLRTAIGCGAAEATGLGFVCFVVINPRVLSANRVDLDFFVP